MEKQLTKELFEQGVKFKIKNKPYSDVYQRNVTLLDNGMEPIESVINDNVFNSNVGNIEKVTNAAVTVFTYVLEQRVQVRIKFEDCVVVEGED